MIRGADRYGGAARSRRSALPIVEFVAEFVDHQQIVAVKVFPYRRREADALRRELAALLAIRHPRVPRLHDWSTAGRHAFVAMDHFERGSLAARFGAATRPDEDEVWQLLEDLL